jgi:hypothetical protein
MSIKTFPKSAIIKTEKAIFHISITPFTNRDTNEIDNYTVNIGSKNNKCVQLNVPAINTKRKEGKFIWAEKIGPVCYLTSKDNRGLTQYTINLAFTIARDINPECTRYIFEDCSSFYCELPDKSKVCVSMKMFHIAFHGATWY